MAKRGRALLAAGTLMVAAWAGPASGLDGGALRLLLLGAEDNNTPPTLLRGDVALTSKTHDGERTTRALLLVAPGKDARWYLQLEEPATRALVLGAEHKVMQESGGTTETLPIGTPIDALGIAYEDLSRFRERDLKLWQITDEGRDTILVGGHANADSAYLYRAYTFDKERKLPVKAQFYAGAFSNLAKLRQDAEHVLVGKQWWPGKIEIQNFPENSTTTLRITWSQAASAPPELLAPESFADAPPLPWAAPAPPAAPVSPRPPA